MGRITGREERTSGAGNLGMPVGVWPNAWALGADGSPVCHSLLGLPGLAVPLLGALLLLSACSSVPADDSRIPSKCAITAS